MAANLVAPPQLLPARSYAMLRALCFPFGIFAPAAALDGTAGAHAAPGASYVFVVVFSVLGFALALAGAAIYHRSRRTGIDPEEGFSPEGGRANPDGGSRTAAARRLGLTVATASPCFRCDGCDCEFPATPDSFILTDPVRMAEDAAEWLPEGEPGPLTRHRLEALTDYELSECGLTQADRQTLLRGGAVFKGADAFCPECLRQIC